MLGTTCLTLHTIVLLQILVVLTETYFNGVNIEITQRDDFIQITAFLLPSAQQIRKIQSTGLKGEIGCKNVHTDSLIMEV